MRDLKQLHSAPVISTGHAFVQNLGRGHYELAWISTPGIDSRRSSPNSHLPSDHSIIEAELHANTQRNTALGRAHRPAQVSGAGGLLESHTQVQTGNRVGMGAGDGFTSNGDLCAYFCPCRLAVRVDLDTPGCGEVGEHF
jgi:hypothetical protein